MYSSATLSPSPETAVPDSATPELDSFAAFLEKLTCVDLGDTLMAPAPTTQQDQEDDVSSLSYEYALRRKPAAASPTLDVQQKPSASIAVAEKRNVRASLCLTTPERDLLRQRAVESSLSVSAYIRSCVFEVEILRAQVKQLADAMRTNSAPQPRTVREETPTLAAPPRQPALPSPMQTRQLKPATPREPQSPSAQQLSPRVQAALEEQRRLSAQLATQKQVRKAETKPGLFGFFFGTRKSA